MDILQEKVDLYELEKEIRDEILSGNVDDHLKYSTYKKLLVKVNEIKKLHQDYYSLIFIGEKGVGKTTSISGILNLVHTVKRRRGNRQVEVIEEILQTGSGATTICDIEILPSSEGCFIEVIPYNEKEVIDYIVSFAEYTFIKTHKDAMETSSGESAPLPPEIERACRNITGLKEVTVDEIRTDKAIEFAKKFESDKIQEFILEVITLAGLEKRTQCQFKYAERMDEHQNELDWIKKMFMNINLGKIETSPLPKVIKVGVSKELFDFTHLPYINRIVDTRGLDSSSNKDRKDMYRIFREETNNIIILVDKFAAPSLSMVDLLNTYAYDKHQNLINRLLFLVNFRDNEPNALVGTDGAVDNEKYGIEIRKNQIIRKFHENNIPFLDENILFYNPLRFLTSEKRLDITMDDVEDYGGMLEAKEAKETIIGQERKLIRVEVAERIENVVENYNKQIYEIKTNFEKLKNTTREDVIVKEQLQKLIPEIEGFLLDNLEVKENVSTIYNEYLGNKYPSTIRAINRRFGIYDNHDILQAGATQIEDQVKYLLKEMKDNVINKLEGIKSIPNLGSQYTVSLQMTIEEINRMYEGRIHQFNQTTYHSLEENVFSKTFNDFWDKTNQRWGKGNGYRNDIIEYYQEQIKASVVYNGINYELVDFVNDFVKELISQVKEIIVD